MYYNWLQSNLRQIKDIWDLDNNNWITEQNLLQTLQQKQSWMMQFLSIKNSVPKEWLQILRGEKPENSVERKLKILEGQMLLFGKNIGKSKNKDLQNILQSNIKSPKCITYWNNIYQKELQWSEIWCNLKNSKCQKKIKDFHWKSLHNVINTNARLKKMNKNDGICRMCETNLEDQKHLFHGCTKLKTLLKNIETHIRSKIRNFNLTEETILTAWTENVSKKESIFIFDVIIKLKWEIWLNRNRKIFENKVTPNKIIIKRTLNI